jgi:hypothetical protein
MVRPRSYADAIAAMKMQINSVEISDENRRAIPLSNQNPNTNSNGGSQ